MSSVGSKLDSLLSDIDEFFNKTGASPPKSERTLTVSERRLFIEKRNEYRLKLDSCWASIENLLPDVMNGTFDLLQLRQQEKHLSKTYDVFKGHSLDFMTFLRSINTRESHIETEMHEQLIKAHEQIINQAKDMLDVQIQTVLEGYSQKTLSSKQSSKHNKSDKSLQSHRSETPSMIARRRAKADSARARLEFIARETDIRKQQAFLDEEKVKADATVERQHKELEADLELLKEQREAAVAQAEVQALENSDSGSGFSIGLGVIDNLPEQQPIDRTSQYVMELSQINQTGSRCEQQITKQRSDFDLNHVNTANKNPSSLPLQVSTNQTRINEAAITSEITRFLLKKELVLSSLTKYNDKPESYRLWKSSFHNIVKELQVSALEEMDLLVKWLGPESARHAVSIRTSNASNPTCGLKRIWERLNERFGSPEMVEASLKKKLSDFPKLSNKDNKLLYDLADILSDIESAKEEVRYQSLLVYFDSSTGVIPIVRKLPYGIQEKWTTTAQRYKKEKGVCFPPFAFFAQFIRDISSARNDPSFAHEVTSELTQKDIKVSKPEISARKTEVAQPSKEKTVSPDKSCPLHHSNHSLNQCKGFRAKSIQERKDFLKHNGICFKCCASNEHMFRACKETVKCAECHSDKHATAMHLQSGYKKSACVSSSNHGGEQTNESTPVTSNCLQICGEGFNGKSCAKTVLVNVYPQGNPEKSHKMYALLDDQSNMSLAKSKFFDIMNIKTRDIPYTLSSCAGSLETSGRRATGYFVESIDHTDRLELKSLIECNDIPSVRSEIPTPDVARHYSHLHDIAKYIPPLDEGAEILLLIGRDLLEAHHIQDQRIGPANTPYAQKSRLGWVIIGEACLGKMHKSNIVNVKRTHILQNSRPSLFQPCPNFFDIREPFRKHEKLNFNEDNIFMKTPADDEIGMSREDQMFLEILDKEMYRDGNGKWVAPLPFRTPRVRLPNNKPQALRRAQTLHRSLQKDNAKKEHFKTFMQRVFDSGHAEVAPALKENEECWYLPIFGVYHPRKPDQIRGVFDSSALYQGVSLNNVLLSGPDFTNSLLGILLRFRKELIAVTADIEQMFYNFMVEKKHRNFLRFLWYKDNDIDKDLIEYRMTVHVFGNSPSPAIATYGLRKAAQSQEETFGKDMTEYVTRNFYVDDGLTSLSTPKDAIDLMKRTQQGLKAGGQVRLHKIASNSSEVMNAFPADDRAKNLRDLDLTTDILPSQRSLGLIWNLATDAFTFRVSDERKSYTKRGVLSTINSLFDPLGFVAPVVIKGKIFLRDVMATTSDWDELLPRECESSWETWRNSLKVLEKLNIPRPYGPTSTSDAAKREIHVFSDASEKAIVVGRVAFVSYFGSAEF